MPKLKPKLLSPAQIKWLLVSLAVLLATHAPNAYMGNRCQHAVGGLALYQHQQTHLHAKSLASGTAIFNAGYVDFIEL